MGSSGNDSGLDWAELGTRWALLVPMGPQLKYVRISEILVVLKCRLRSKNNAFGSVWQNTKKQSYKTCALSCHKLIWSCSLLHSSAMTLTNSAGCAQLEGVLLGPGSQVPCMVIKSSFGDLIGGARRARGSSISGGVDCGLVPPYHTRRGSG